MPVNLHCLFNFLLNPYLSKLIDTSAPNCSSFIHALINFFLASSNS
nr:MAG TPA: hypothetical protein [Caudoviricetes sp.]